MNKMIKEKEDSRNELRDNIGYHMENHFNKAIDSLE